MSNETLPVAVIGAGPVGLAAAAQLISRGETPLVLEAGASVGASILKWSHVRIFSPWRHDVDPASSALLLAAGWVRPPDDEYPTGGDLVHRYLEPLAALPVLRPHIRLNTRVRGVSRRGFDRTRTARREGAAFVLRVERDGVEEDMLAKAVIDASGTYETPNPLGGSGTAAIGENAAREHIYYGIPDVLGRDRARYAGRRVLVVGSGHSAFGTLLDLAKLRLQEGAAPHATEPPPRLGRNEAGSLAPLFPRTQLWWAVRRPSLDRVFGGGDADQLAERGLLGQRMRELVEQDALQVFTDFAISRIERREDGLVVASEDRELPPVDEIVAATGFRPDLSILREVRLELDAVVESPALLAPLIDPNVHSCGTVPPHGFEELRHPEPGFYVVGMKSYGRAPTFLMLTGYEQVRSVVAALAGDLEAARRVELTLPETGVCSTDLAGVASSCGPEGCGTPITLTAAPSRLARQECC